MSESSKKPKGSSFITMIFVFLLIVATSYFVAFRATVVRAPVAIYHEGLRVAPDPEYVLFGRHMEPQGLWAALFQPAWIVDRVIRTDYWCPP